MCTAVVIMTYVMSLASSRTAAVELSCEALISIMGTVSYRNLQQQCAARPPHCDWLDYATQASASRALCVGTAKLQKRASRGLQP